MLLPHRGGKGGASRHLCAIHLLVKVIYMVHRLVASISIELRRTSLQIRHSWVHVHDIIRANCKFVMLRLFGAVLDI